MDLSARSWNSVKSSLGWTCVVLGAVASGNIILMFVFQAIRVVEAEVARVKKLNQQLVLATIAAESADRSKSTFLATMSHEIRTPCNGIIGMNTLLMDTPLSAVQQDYVQTALVSGATLLSLISNILDMSKIEAGHMDIEDSVEFEVRSEVSELLHSFAEQARQQGLGLNALVQDSVPEQLVGDPNRFKQVLNNLLSNAMKFTKAGGILLCVQVGSCTELQEEEWSPAESDAGTTNSPSGRPLVRWVNFDQLETPSMQPGVVTSATDVLRMRRASHHNFQQSVLHNRTKLRLVVSCSDTGIGIAPSAQLRLFTPFLQADATTSRKYGGTGIGLSICQKLIRLMGGEISVATREGVGSTFQFDVMVGVGKARNVSRELHELRVVVVERDAVHHEVLASSLRWLGCPVDDFVPLPMVSARLHMDWPPSGPQKRVYFLSLDDPLQRLAVFKLVGWIQSQPGGKDCAMVGILSYQDKHVKAEALSAGLDSVLLRPVRRSVLLSAVNRALSLAMPKENPTGQAMAGDLLRLKRARALVVDDGCINRKVVTRLLENMGLDVAAVSSGQQGVELMRAEALTNGNRIAIVFMDVQMPDMDGYEATIRIRLDELSRCPHERANRTLHHVLNGVSAGQLFEETACGLCRVPIIALTADVMKGCREQCMAAGMDDFLPKPLQKKHLQLLLVKYVCQDRGISRTIGPNEDR
ncbi:histidine kinase [Klebsormidium nitens]|uniref:Histidine kinase n=1 Tax=Klebsormidium nitens TaxID=105231 RepID=A0A1Y1IP61_KLENI|nr:histidine kinase [Klebsormidium nitens]|eukprot:GAQ91882.1 histidine kinase [Klebsormidium nitens]